ncbi:MAG: hypothetical protein GY757_16880 [bacterium]|nr:hypothetical protein [bacterium]
MKNKAMRHFFDSILAFSRQDAAEAARLAGLDVKEEPGNLLFKQASVYLDRIRLVGKHSVYSSSVYSSGEGFAAFTRGGGNVPLYKETSAALRCVYREYKSLSLLDIGVGEGMAILPALTDNVGELDLLEPSEAMLNRTCAGLDERGISYRAFNGTLQQFEAHARDILQYSSISPGGTKVRNWDLMGF